MSNKNPLLSALVPSIRDLEDTVSDFRNATFESGENLLERFMYCLGAEPLAGFLKAVLPETDFDKWFKQANSTIGSFVGSGTLAWPPSRPERVAMQIALCSEITNKTIPFLDFIFNFFYSGNNIKANLDSFVSNLLTPLVRDIERLTEARPLPPILFEAMGSLPTSGDHILDELLSQACKEFKDAAPTSRSEATKKLWDAWERLKTLDGISDKRISVVRLLEQCSSEPLFVGYLKEEATALTKIGNEFHIRHFEINKLPITLPEHNDYLFHRLYALIHLLLFSRKRNQGAD